ncbi:hypothetical protein ACKKBF_B21575 [Auxenochlorella protothecoides x Auxenochlorella symbiontica]
MLRPCRVTCMIETASTSRHQHQLYDHKRASKRPLTVMTPTGSHGGRLAAPRSGLQAAATASPPGEEFWAGTDQRPIILFDGACNLCNGGVGALMRLDTEAHYRLAALQSEAGRKLLVRVGRAPEDLSSIVLVTQSGFWIKSEAILRIAQGLPQPTALAATAIKALPIFIRDKAYDAVAGSRYALFGQPDACRLDHPGYQDRFLRK